MDELSKCVDCIESKFFLYEKLERGINITINNKDNTESSVEFPIENSKAKDTLKPILDIAHESPFGIGDKTVVDKDIRNAMHLLPEQFSSDFNPKESGILDKIRDILVPEASEVTATLLKMNIYTKGGHFKMHKDTPRGENCFGSLVVCLPSTFYGGCLNLHHVGIREYINFDRYTTPSYIRMGQPFEEMEYTPKKLLQWVAFFGDVDHEVHEVTKGYRITLSYTLHRTDKKSIPANILHSRAKRCQKTLEKLLLDEDFMPEGGEIGYFCKHKYEETQLKAIEAKLKDPTKPKNKNVYVSQLKLKNEDSIIGIVFANCKLPVQCLRIMECGEDYNDEGPLCIKYMPKKSDIKKIARPVMIEGSFKALGVDIEDITEMDIVESHLDSEIEWIGNHKPPKFVWGEVWASGTGYFGNEASPTDFYTYAAIIATIPPYEDRIEDFKAIKITEEQLTPKITKPKAKPKTKPKTTPKTTKVTGKRKQPEKPRKNTRAKKLTKTKETTETTQEPGGPPSITPVLFESTPTKNAMSSVRVITVIEGKGGLASRCNGQASVTLQPGEGLKELKQRLRKHFGKVPSMRMSSLVRVNEDGSKGNAVATKDLVDGMKLACTYTFAPGNPQSLRPYSYGRRRGDDCIIS